MKENLTLGDLFSTFKKSAKRLEILQTYHIEGDEWKNFQDFQQGKPTVPFDELVSWNKDIQTWRRQGKIIERVRVVENPLSDYLKYEIFDGYIPSKVAGQDVYFVSSKNFKNMIKEHKDVRDFWIFDDKYIFEMIYDKNNNFVDAKLVEDTYQSKLYEKLKESSISLEEVLKQIRNQKTKIRF